MLGEQTVQFLCQSQQSLFSLYNRRDIHMHRISLKPRQITQSECSRGVNAACLQQEMQAKAIASAQREPVRLPW